MVDSTLLCTRSVSDMNAETLWGAILERQPPNLERYKVTVKWPWHRGWLGPVKIIRLQDSFKLSRSQALDYILSQRKLGIEVEEIK